MTQFFQAVLEGIAEIEAWAYSRFSELGAPALKSVRSIGGGANNQGWARIRQRLLGAPFERSLSHEASVGTARPCAQQYPGGCCHANSPLVKRKLEELVRALRPQSLPANSRTLRLRGRGACCGKQDGAER